MNIIKENVTNEIFIKKSRFITKLIYVDDVNKVDDILNNLKKEYKKSTHICYAYRINGLEKAFDDKEPSKTAGWPILNVLQKKDVNNILAVVIRYFGGVKLGAGGLVRAYTNSISMAFKLTEINKE